LGGKADKVSKKADIGLDRVSQRSEADPNEIIWQMAINLIHFGQCQSDAAFSARGKSMTCQQKEFSGQKNSSAAFTIIWTLFQSKYFL
jgi:hypothetical protein